MGLKNRDSLFWKVFARWTANGRRKAVNSFTIGRWVEVEKGRKGKWWNKHSFHEEFTRDYSHELDAKKWGDGVRWRS